VRAASVCLALAALGAPVFAQDSQQDIAERIVREQEEVRRKAVDKVMEAPARAWEHSESDPYHAIGSDPRPAAPEPAPAPPSAPAKPRGAFPWLTVAFFVVAVPLAVLGFATLRRWLREQR
jgi:hypothetical protein